MKRILSGVRPTGEIHLGNYLGAIANWVDLQHQMDDNFFCIVICMLSPRSTKAKTWPSIHALSQLRI